jgi:hypothetical protein
MTDTEPATSTDSATGAEGAVPRRGPHPAVRPALAAAALRAAAAGWPVFPVVPRDKAPAVPNWENVATVDPDRIRAWWSRAPWNVGVATGPAGLLVLDLDISDTGPGMATLLQLAAAADAQAPLCTYTVATPSGGRHLYFAQPTGAALRNTQGLLGAGIDTRGHGGCVLAAGSRGPRDLYCVLRDAPIAPLPAWLHQALAPPPAGPAPRLGRPDGEAPVVFGARVQAYLRAVVDGEARAVAAAPVGARHTTLLRAARRLGQWVGGRALDEADARGVLTLAAQGYLGVAGYTTRQVDRDITDGLVYGAARPRHPHDIVDRPARPDHPLS